MSQATKKLQWICRNKQYVRAHQTYQTTENCLCNFMKNTSV